MTFAPGSKLGPYEILVPIGAGGMEIDANQIEFVQTNVQTDGSIASFKATPFCRKKP
jgi:hypothetical protein